MQTQQLVNRLVCRFLTTCAFYSYENESVSQALNIVFSGFAGKQCETNIDDCATLDCGHGKCVDGINSGECNCTGSGYNGTKCKQDVNECLTSDTCRNNGTCTNYAGGFLCKCLEDYRGKHCEERIDDCASNPCQNGKTLTYIFALLIRMEPAFHVVVTVLAISNS